MKKLLIIPLICYQLFAQAENTHTKFENKEIKILPSGTLSEKPIISDSTFAIISKKSKLDNKDFTDEDLKKLDIKFSKVVSTLKSEKVFEKIAIISKKYNVSPEAVAACIIGEHVFNVGLVDKFQNYFVNIYSKWLDKHNSVQHLYLELLEEKDIKEILNSSSSDYEKWDQIFNIYNQKHRGTKNYPNSNFVFSFFNPYGAGLTYGLGQLSPIRVLLTNDIAVKLGGLKKIEPSDTESLYFATLDVETNINYVSASVVASIENYKKYANVDISNNIGVIATLYNLGDEKRRAKLLNKTNESLLKDGKSEINPIENFYGWYMNKKETDIKKLFNH